MRYAVEDVFVEAVIPLEPAVSVLQAVALIMIKPANTNVPIRRHRFHTLPIGEPPILSPIFYIEKTTVVTERGDKV